MLLNNNKQNRIPFYKTLKFKLTFWYSFLFFVGGCVLIFFINFSVEEILIRRPQSQQARLIEIFRPDLPNKVKEFVIENNIDIEDKLMQKRLEDLEYIRTQLILLLIPLLIFSSIGGWYIASKSLEPLNILNDAINKASLENLQDQIKGSYKDDELGEVIKNFINMQRKLAVTYNQQNQFIDDVSHELKTPISSIMAEVDDTLDNPDLRKEDYKKVLIKNKMQLKSMNNLIEQMLTIAKLQNTQSFEIIDITKVVKNNIQNHIKKISDIAGEINVVSPEMQINIKGREDYFERVISNLVENSIKFRKENESLKILINIYKSNNELIIEFIDNGKGINKNNIKKVFQRFFRGDESRSKAIEGYGLGLSIVKKLVENMGGNISIESEENKGAKFILKFKVI